LPMAPWTPLLLFAGEQRLETEDGVERLVAALLLIRNVERGELALGQLQLGGGEHPLAGQGAQRPLSALHRPPPPRRLVDVHLARRLRDAGEEGDLRPAQLLDRLVEVPPGRVGNAVDAVAVGHDAQVVAEDLLASVAQREEDGGERLLRLAHIAAFAWAL